MHDNDEFGENEEQVSFVLGTGNQSAICGGVTPMEIADSSAISDAPTITSKDTSTAAH